MMDNSNAEFSTEEQAEFARLELESMNEPLPISDHQANPPAADDKPAGNVEPAKVEAPAAATKDEAAPAATTNEPAKPTEERPEGDLRQALRASRRAEKRAREQRDVLAEENAQLKAKVPDAPAADAISDDVLAGIDEDYPAIAPIVRALKAKVDQLDARAPKAAEPDPGQPEFEPEPLDDAAQELVDSSPDLLAWHGNKDQSQWNAVKAADFMLSQLPHWHNKPADERAKEAVRLVKVQSGIASTPQPTAAEIARKRIEQAPVVGPNGLADIRGGGTTERTGPDYSKMTDDEIMSSIGEG
jgi:hypothetical protein